MSDTTNTYGAINTNTITPEQRIEQQNAKVTVDLDDPRLARITRLRLVTDRDFPLWDVSYCFGRLTDGSAVRVRLPQWQFSKADLNGELIRMCRDAKVFGRGIGLFDPEVISKLYG